jgi:predicted ferric reductase
MLIVLIVLALAIVALVSAAYMYESNMQFAVFLLATGVIAMGLSVYVMFQSRKRVAHMKIEAPKVMTTIECKKCNFKSVREFQRGDFVFKNLEPCEKCSENKLITAIYKEVKEKEKTYGV